MSNRERALALLRGDPRLTRAAVARQLSLPPSTVRYWANNAGIKSDGPGRPTKHPAGVADPHWYHLPKSVNAEAMTVLAQHGLVGVPALLDGIAQGYVVLEILKEDGQ